MYFKSCHFPSLSSSNQVNIPIIKPNASKDSPSPPTLQVYSHRQTSHHQSNEFLLVPTPHPPPALIVELNIPIAIRKGIHSTRNPSPHYTALSYH